MRAAHLTPPRFEDKRSSFWVTFRNHTLLGPEAVSWLNKFGGYRLTDDQRIAMVFARQSGMMTNRDYRALCNVDIAMATRELRSLCAQGIFAQFGTSRWTTYSLASQFIDKPVAQPAFSEAGDAVMRYVLQHGNITNREVQELLSVNRDQASRLLGRLRTAGVLVSHGTGRWTIYSRPA
jgi:ATP-dependent DNA helicase RecG